IQNLDGYLYGVLRNMHMSRVRRAARIRRQDISVVDFDSAEIWLRSASPDTVVQSRDLLTRVCHYACVRKETSKSGSILILRFFHGYYPTEIARIARCQRRAVDDWMLIARKEARLQIDQIDQTIRPIPVSSSANNFLDQLRKRIFDSRKGLCLAEDELTAIYEDEGDQALGYKLLAHIVSCITCLERVNNILHLPPLSDRFPTDMLGNDVSIGRSGPRRVAAGMKTHETRRLARSVYNHSPNELILTVNGFFTASEKLTSKLCERAIVVGTAEKISIVEAFSEQGVRLAGLHVEPPPEGDLSQRSSVNLSDGRRLELSISFEGVSPTITTKYENAEYLWTPEPETAPLSQDVDDSILRLARVGAKELETAKPQRTDAQTRGTRGTVLTGRPRPLGVLGRLFGALAQNWITPGTVTAAMAMVLIAVIAYFQLHPTRVLADQLLRQAAQAEGAQAVNHPGLIQHRRFAIEQRRLAPASSTVQKQTVELWTNPANGLKARRVYDSNGQLSDGEWIDNNGRHSLFRRGLPAVSQNDSDDKLGPILDSGDLWRLGLSASEFLGIVDHPERALVQSSGGSYVIKWSAESRDSSNGVVNASITLKGSELRAVDETLDVRHSESLVEYRFSEMAYETVPVGSVQPSVFQPETGAPDTISKPLSRLGTVEPGAGAPAAEPALTDGEYNTLKTDVIYELHRAGACLTGAQADFEKTSDGKLRVQLLTEGEGRKNEMTKALGSLASNPRVQLGIKTFQEAAAVRPQTVPDSASVRRIDVTGNTIPAYNDLRTFFQSHTSQSPAKLSGAAVPGAGQPGPDPARDHAAETQMDDRIRTFAGKVLKDSRQAVTNAWALRHHAEESPAAASLAPLEREEVLAMVRDHAKEVLRETEALRNELGPIFAGAGASGPGAAPAEAVPDISSASERLLSLTLANERTIQGAFSIGPDGHQSSPALDSDEFWRSLRETESIAAGLLAACTKQ
ncbi:MAG TPA: hypothetical protein VI756_30775, partial [Blastocatellia bacterium]